jgi:hypothetical protein
MDLVSVKVHIKRPRFSKLGNCFVVFLNDSLLIVVGPHWPFMFCVTPIIVSVLVGFVLMIAPEMDFYYQIIGTCIVLTALFSYLATALKDPGVVLSEYESDLQEDTTGQTSLCTKCLIFKDLSIEHCDDCGLCMKELDHHCIFTGKCIAKNNLFCFYLMLTSIFGFFAFAIIWVMLAFPFIQKRND